MWSAVQTLSPGYDDAGSWSIVMWNDEMIWDNSVHIICNVIYFVKINHFMSAMGEHPVASEQLHDYFFLL